MKTFSAIALSLALLSGCASVGNMPQGTMTSVVLAENNYRIAKAGIAGRSSGFNLFCVLPIVSPTYADAKSNLYQAMGDAAEGRAMGLANQTFDRSLSCFLLFGIPKITITADVVEFSGPSGGVRR